MKTASISLFLGLSLSSSAIALSVPFAEQIVAPRAVSPGLSSSTTRSVVSSLSVTSQPTLSQGSTRTSSSSSSNLGRATAEAVPSCAPYWLESIKHQGLASFNGNPGNYKVHRNVRDYGAKGDGITDDTAAINLAISSGNRCTPGFCESSTTSPAVVYFPAGTYLISDSIVDYYYTQIIGNANCPPTIRAAAGFNKNALGLIDGSKYQGSGPRVGRTAYGATNTFFRQVRNLVLDTTRVPANVKVTGIHWPTAQTTSLQNIIFNMNATSGTQHEGLFVEEGSGGFMTDLVFNGGNKGFDVGNQQFTTRNLTFNNVNTAITQLWDWGWTYKSVKINNCRVGLDMTAGGTSAVNVGSITFIDSEINNTPVGISTTRTDNSQPDSAGALYLENVKLINVPVAVKGPSGTYLAGTTGSTTITAWADGHRYLPTGPNEVRGPIAPSKRPTDLLDPLSGKFYERSKPQYESLPLSQFISARDQGARGDGRTDDTAALNKAIATAKAVGKVLFLDAGYYRVTGTIDVPAGSIIVGEALAAVIMSSGPYFDNINGPQAVVRVGKQGEQGRVEISDVMVSSQGRQRGAILIEYNLGTYNTPPSGLWDVHTRIGGFAGSNLQAAQCIKTPDIKITNNNLQQNCIAAYMSMHVTKYARGLYMENNWLWTADHDLDDPKNINTQITIYTGRGLLVESMNGAVWLYGTAVEHHAKYQYQFVDTRNVFMGQIQTETAYYQPNPDASIPFPQDLARNDPVFLPSRDGSVPSTNGWGLRILRSNSLLAYGAGLYSFFNNYSTTCSNVASQGICQTRILSIEGNRNSYDINIYNLNTVGATQMITRDGVDLATNKDNNSTYVDGINVFRIGAFGQ